MSKEILSLKSIYQFLTISDYPIYSTGIITRKNHTGLTLTKFWQGIILVDFKNRRVGKQIWRTEGGRNRYLSEICNRSERFHNYKEYAEEVAAAANSDTVVRQIIQFVNFLQERQFDYQAFERKITAYIELLGAEDYAFGRRAQEYFCQAMAQKEDCGKLNSEEEVFCCAWFLTMLMFHGLSGNGEGESSLENIRDNEELEFKALLARFCGNKNTKKMGPVFMTNKNTELCSPPLEARHFFGREKELFELREMLNMGGKYLVSGIGGIGKTELLRQFVHICEKEQLVDYICTVQYEKNLVESMIRAFPYVYGQTQEEKFKEVLAQIRFNGAKKILILIDNMDKGLEEDASIVELQHLPATVFISSRRQKLEGFTSFLVEPLDKASSGLVFRDNYGKVLPEEDKSILDAILQENMWRHTLTLRLLGHSARNGGRTLKELSEMLEKRSGVAYKDREEVYRELRHLYRKMYDTSKIMKDGEDLLIMFSLLPYQNYTPDFVNRFLSGYVKEGVNPKTELEVLWESGWLEKRQGCYSMHPFLAECVRPKQVSEEQIAPMRDSLLAEWTKENPGGRKTLDDWIFWYENRGEADPLLVSGTVSLFAMADYIDGDISEKTVRMLLLAAQIKTVIYGVDGGSREFWLKVREQCKDKSEKINIEVAIMLCVCGYENLEELDRIYRGITTETGISDKLYTLFADELGRRYYQQGNTERMMELYNEILEKNDISEQYLYACYYLSVAYAQRGDLVTSMEWLKKIQEAVERSEWEGKFTSMEFLQEVCYLYIALEDFEQAEVFLNRLDRELQFKNNIWANITSKYFRGHIAMRRKDPGHGVEQLREAAELMHRGYGEVAEYGGIVADLARACTEAGMLEEAGVYYQKSLELCRKTPEREFDIVRTLSNMSILYLDLEKPEEAMIYLEEAVPIAEKMGGVLLAAVQNNISKVWRARGDREQELIWLNKAYPVLEETCSPEDPKLVYAKERLNAE